MTNFKTIIESYIQDMEKVAPGEWLGEVTAEQFLDNFDWTADSLETAITQLLAYGSGKFPEEIAKMWELDELSDMAQHIKDNW